MLLHPTPELEPAKLAFLASYTGKKGANQFTKVRISLAADAALQSYFSARESEIAGWFDVIAPDGKELNILKDELNKLKNKNWQETLR
ncbi:MAG: hypothetical protein ACP5VQ_00575 [Phycisphaerae bacterium]